MRTTNNPSKTRRGPGFGTDLRESLAGRLVGQPDAVETVVPYVRMYQAGLAPEHRPAGVFLLLGPSGTGKTRTVEALANALHGNEKAVLKIDCGEYQMEHEVAKLIGAPPGYLGHRETQPVLTQARLNAVTSERSSLALVLFDEIEKAATSMARLLLGVLDKGTLRLGDNNTVNFERTLIFMTSNLGAREMMRAMRPGFGFAGVMGEPDPSYDRLGRIGMASLRRKFSPEFLNRIDAVVTYRPLDTDTLSNILNQQLDELEELIASRLGADAFLLDLDDDAFQFLLERGTSREYGARELKRTIHRHLVQPIATLVAEGLVDGGGRILVTRIEDSLHFEIEAPSRGRRPPKAA